MTITTETALEGGGTAFRVRTYAAADPAGPIVVWLHGGAFMFGSIDMLEAHAVALAFAEQGVTTVSVDYTLAPLDAMPDLDAAATPEGMPSPEAIRAELAAAGPRARFPVASLQVVAAFDWAVANAAAFGGDPLRVAVGGASAGGNLAAGAAVRLRDRGDAQPSALLLAYPVLHTALPPTPPDLAAALEGVPSMLTFPDEDVAAFNHNYVGDDALLDDPRAFPGGHPVAGLPATVVVTAERDRLRLSGEAFAHELEAAGVQVDLLRIDGALHGFLNEPGGEPSDIAMEHFTAALLRR